VKKYSILLLIVLVLAVGCQDKAAKIEEQPGQQKAAVDETAAGGFTGTALETIKADRYTYVQVDIGTEKIWTATPNWARWEIPWSFPRDWPCRTFTARLLSAILRWSTL
jgi:hypothetical protein